MKNIPKKYYLLLPIAFLFLFFLFPSNASAALQPGSPPFTVPNPTEPGLFDYPNRTGFYRTVQKPDGSHLSALYKFDGNDEKLEGILKTNQNGQQTYYAANPLISHGIDEVNAINEIGGPDTWQLFVKTGNDARSSYVPTPGIPPSDCIEWPVWNAFQINPEICIARFVANPLLWLSSRILWLAGLVFNFTLNWSLKMKELVDQTKIVTTCWKIFRDIANLCFIFILLAIAIGTILQVDSYSVKKLLARVIIIAILLNFSLFFAKVIIDASNILALQFYSRIAPNPNNLDGGVSAAFIQGLGLESVYKAGGNGTNDSSKDFVANEAKTKNVIFIGILGSALILVTAFVLFVGTILFIIRTVVLMMLLILSPLAFLAWVLPNTTKYWSMWIGTLLKQSFFAPLFLIMIYVVFAAINEKSFQIGGGTTSFSSLLAGSESATPVIYTFILLIGLMLASLLIAKTLGAYGGDLARNVAGKATFGVAGWTGRQTIGRTARNLQNSGIVKRLASGRISGALGGRALERGLKRTSEGSYDIRAISPSLSKTAGLGDAGGKGGFAKSFEDRRKRLEDQAKRVGAPTESEDRKAISTEDERDKVQSLQAASLLEEREQLENNITAAERAKAQIENSPQMQQSQNAIAQLENEKIQDESAYHNVVATKLNQIEVTQQNISTATNPAAKAAAQASKDRLEAELKIETQKHENTKRQKDININTHKQAVAGMANQVNQANTTINESKNLISKKDAALHKINEKYDKDAGKQANLALIKEMKDEAAKNMSYARKKKLVDATTGKLKSSTEIGKEVANLQGVIKTIQSQSKDRKENYMKPGMIDRGLSKLGMTTVQMQAFREMRADDRKGADKKLLDQIKKLTEQSQSPSSGGQPSAPPSSSPPTPPSNPPTPIP